MPKQFVSHHKYVANTIVYSNGQVAKVSYDNYPAFVDERPTPEQGDFHRPMFYYRKVLELTGDAPRVTRDGTGTISTNYLPSSEYFWTINVDFSDMDQVNLDNLTITEALNKLSGGDREFGDAVTKMQLGAALGEGQQTIKLFANACSKFARALVQARRQNWPAVLRILEMRKEQVLSGQFPANVWLEYQYGWKPLASDIHALQQKVHEDMLADRKVVSVSRSKKLSKEHSWVDRNQERTLKRTISSRTELVYEVEVPLGNSLQSWGVANPLSIAWELTPFSFVIDWFVPVGNSLDALTATLGLNYIRGWTSSKTQWTFSIKGGPDGDLSDETVVIQPGYCEYQERGFVRRPHVVSPLPKIYANPSPVTLSHTASALALLRQLY